MTSSLRVLRRHVHRLVRPVLSGHAPDFLIIGAQKAGTSTLHHWLSLDPAFAGSHPKELRYFSDHAPQGMSLTEYERCFTSLRPGRKLFFESTPQYLYHPDCAARIARVYPQIRLIAVLREPIARAWSAWTMYDRLAREGIITPAGLRDAPPPGPGNRLFELLIDSEGRMRPFAECLRIERDLIAQPGGAAAHEPGLLRRGLYLDQLERYAAHFPSERLLVLGFGELTRAPQATLARIRSFLGLSGPVTAPLQDDKRNVNQYLHDLDADIRRELTSFYAAPNAALFEQYGVIDW